MAEYRITYWRDIPSMVTARDESGATAKVQLPDRFQELIDQRAMDATKTIYNAPGSSCSKNYVILIGNGFGSGDDTNCTLLSGVGGATTQLSMHTYTNISEK